MSPENTEKTCRAKKGLLFLRDCGKPAVTECSKCNCPVCREHETAGIEGTLCPQCAAGDKRVTNRNARRYRRRNRYYSGYGYHPYYYGHHHYYSNRDYRTFDERGSVEGAAPADGEVVEPGGTDAVDGFDDAGSDFDSDSDGMTES
jgi:hypothetical protein